MADRPALEEEIEITPEMIDAGKAAFSAWMVLGDDSLSVQSLPPDPSVSALLSAIFRSMMARSPDSARNAFTSLLS